MASTLAFSMRRRVLNLERDETGRVVLAMVDIADDFSADALRLRIGVEVARTQVSDAQFRHLLSERHGPEAEAHAQGGGRASVEMSVEPDATDDGDAPVIRFIQSALSEARARGASDIHLTAAARRCAMTFRIGGELVEAQAPPVELFSNVISRLKVLANLDISEKRLPQDGRIRANVNGSAIDLRISTMPHIHGEGAVLRLLAREPAVTSLSELGFSSSLAQRLRQVLQRHDGLFLVTGPTGSGKTTTLHAALRELTRPGVNIVTVEDPVEYRIDAIRQVQVDERIGLTFPVVLRSLLRQDPDVILVGEIRDGETARIAIQAALTGHLVLATLHTNSALGAVSRLIDMGVEPFILGAVLRGAMAQRLVRRPVGGAARVAIGELVIFDEALTALIARGGMANEVEAHLAAQGYQAIHADARSRIAAGELRAQDVAAVLHDG